jgi:hypothetical protein
VGYLIDHVARIFGLISLFLGDVAIFLDAEEAKSVVMSCYSSLILLTND